MRQIMRLDKFLIDRGLVGSKNRAQALIMTGKVQVQGQKVLKPGYGLDPSQSAVEVIDNSLPFVSRGGAKLQAVLCHFKLNVCNMVVLDCGISTGGFSDCLLKNGVKQVIGVDVGYGQVAWDLRQDSRLLLMERTNLRYLTLAELPHPVDLVCLDLSFISLSKIIDAVIGILRANGEILALVKPQFELERHEIGKGGIVRETRLHEKAVTKIVEVFKRKGLTILGHMRCPLQGLKGNQEFFVYCRCI